MSPCPTAFCSIIGFFTCLQTWIKTLVLSGNQVCWSMDWNYIIFSLVSSLLTADLQTCQPPKLCKPILYSKSHMCNISGELWLIHMMVIFEQLLWKMKTDSLVTPWAFSDKPLLCLLLRLNIISFWEERMLKKCSAHWILLCSTHF